MNLRAVSTLFESEIHRLMSELAQQGLAIIMISRNCRNPGNERPSPGHARGRATGEISRKDASQEAIMTLATGGKL
jgi:inositol transport system ATP-binding protein